jgi:hypothetical protein
MAFPTNGPTCSSSGITLDGVDDYVDVMDWEWGGTTSVEVLVKYDSFNSGSRVFDFGGADSNNIILANYGTTSTITWCGLIKSYFDSSTWTHVVVTVSGTTLKMYKNGVLVGTQTDGWEPTVLTRTNHFLSNGKFDGTIAYLKMWHGVELQQTDATTLAAATCFPGEFGTGVPNCSPCPFGSYSER